MARGAGERSGVERASGTRVGARICATRPACTQSSSAARAYNIKYVMYYTMTYCIMYYTIIYHNVL